MQQRRRYIVSSDTVADLLREYGLDCASGGRSIGVQISIDRTTYTPLLTITNPADSDSAHSIPFPYNSTDERVSQVFLEAARKFDNNSEDMNKLADQISKLIKLYKEKEAEKLNVNLIFDPSRKAWRVTENNMEFNDSSFRTSKRQKDLWDRRVGRASSIEAEAIEHGIVYVPLAGDGNIGTIGTLRFQKGSFFELYAYNQ